MNECDSETWFDRLLFSRKGPFQLKMKISRKKADFAGKMTEYQETGPGNANDGYFF